MPMADPPPGPLDRIPADRLGALLRAISAINSAKIDLDAVLQEIVEAAKVVANAQYAALGVLDNDGRTLARFLHTGMAAATVERIGNLPTGKGVLGAVIVEGRTIRLEHLADHPASYGFPAHHPPMDSFLGVPLRTASQVVGNLYMTNKVGGGPFTEEDEALITVLAGQAALAVDMATRYERERELTTRLQRLVEVNTVLTGSRQVDEALQEIVESAADLVGARYAGLGVLGPDGDEFSSFIHTGIDADTVAAIGDLPTGKGVMRAVMVGGRPVRLEQLDAHPASIGFPPNHPPMHSFLGVPVAYRGEVIGDLYLTDKQDAHDFTDIDEMVAVALAAQAAVIISNARHFEREQALVAELQEADAAKEAFVSHVAHELRTPLATMRGSLQAMRLGRQTMTVEQQTELEDMSFRNLDRMLDMVGNLLELARIQSGRATLDLTSVQLEEMVEEALSTAPPPDGKSVHVDVDGEHMVVADKRYLPRIVSNLLTNAYRHGGPNITLQSVRTDGGISVTVADDGDGVPEYLRDKLFERFTKGAGSDGTGLGLGLVKLLAERFGGDAAYREGPDGGAMFEVVLPSGA